MKRKAIVSAAPQSVGTRGVLPLRGLPVCGFVWCGPVLFVAASLKHRPRVTQMLCPTRVKTNHARADPHGLIRATFMELDPCARLTISFARQPALGLSSRALSITHRDLPTLRLHALNDRVLVLPIEHALGHGAACKKVAGKFGLSGACFSAVDFASAASGEGGQKGGRDKHLQFCSPTLSQNSFVGFTQPPAHTGSPRSSRLAPPPKRDEHFT